MILRYMSIACFIAADIVGMMCVISQAYHNIKVSFEGYDDEE